MNQRTRSSIVSGAVLIVIGVALLVLRAVPSLFTYLSWPWIVVGVGALFMLLALVTVTPGLAVPACIIGGIGLILLWQNSTGRWETWSYAWTLIPGFVGVGILVAGLLEARPLKALLDALWPILVSAVLFVLFASFLGEPRWGFGFWPVFGIALIAIGALIILQPLLRRIEKKDK